MCAFSECNIKQTSNNQTKLNNQHKNKNKNLSSFFSLDPVFIELDIYINV